MKPYFVHFIFAVLLSFFTVGQPAAANPPAAQTGCITPAKQLNFADHCFDKGRFPDAIAEYERFLFFFPDHPDTARARYRLARASFNAGRFADATRYFGDIINDAPDHALDAYFDLADCYAVQKDYKNALKILIKVSGKAPPDGDIKDLAAYKAGWVLLEDHRFALARRAFSGISAENHEKFQLSPLLDRLALSKDIPRKSPSIAGVMGIVPGGGYLYCGRLKDAVFAFALNSGLIWAAVEAFDNDRPAMGSLITLVGTGFYAGSIYGGISSAHKYNRRETEAYISGLKGSAPAMISIDPTPSNPAISVSIPF